MAESPYRRAIEALDLLGEPDEPVLLVIEDAHWLDTASWETLSFLGRRVEEDRIAVLMSVRGGADIDRRLAAAGLPEIQAGAVIGDGRRPAARVELGAAAVRGGRGALLPSSLPLSTRVERTFGGLVADLPPLPVTCC